MRTIGILLLFAGVFALGYGVWRYHKADNEFDYASAKSVVENGDTPPAIWIGGALLLGGGIATAVARNRSR